MAKKCKKDTELTSKIEKKNTMKHKAKTREISLGVAGTYVTDVDVVCCVYRAWCIQGTLDYTQHQSLDPRS